MEGSLRQGNSNSKNRIVIYFISNIAGYVLKISLSRGVKENEYNCCFSSKNAKQQKTFYLYMENLEMAKIIHFQMCHLEFFAIWIPFDNVYVLNCQACQS